MNMIRKLTFRTLMLNRKRTVVTIVGILLATSLVTAVANVAESLNISVLEYEKRSYGDYHYCFKDVAQEDRKYFENNRNIERIGYSEVLGYAYLAGGQNENKPYLYVLAMDEAGMKAASLELVEGRLPQTEDELLVSKHIGTNGGVSIRVGDRIRLAVGNRESDGFVLGQNNPYQGEAETLKVQSEREYTVVGVMNRPNYLIESTAAPGYTAVTYFDAAAFSGKETLYVSYTKKALRDETAVTAELLEACGRAPQEIESPAAEDLIRNTRVISAEKDGFWGNYYSRLVYSMAAMALIIIVIASVFCIRNSFTISLTEKTRLYGMLSSVGCTRKQLRSMVYTEGMFLGLIGIPLGIFFGVAAVFIILRITGSLLMTALELRLIYAVSFPAILLGALLSAVTIYFSARKSAVLAARTSPINAIRGNDFFYEPKRKTNLRGRFFRKAKTDRNGPKIMTNIVNRLFGIGGVIAYKNLRRSRVKYRTTVAAIVVSVATFISLSMFTDLSLKALDTRYSDKEYQFLVTLNDAHKQYQEEAYENALELVRLPGITKQTVERTLGLFTLTCEFDYTKAFSAWFSPEALNRMKMSFEIISLGEDSYAAYCRQLGLSPEKTADKAILIAIFDKALQQGGVVKREIGRILECREGQVLSGELDLGNEKDPVFLEIPVALQTDTLPLSSAVDGYDKTYLVVSDRWIMEHREYLKPEINVYIRCENPDLLEEKLENTVTIPDYSIQNSTDAYREDASLYLTMAIFLYGFIAVIALIGITNIVNTITTNIELRSREFAMLKSVGMTGREFHRMIRLETLFYGVKSLAIGITLGSILSYCFYQIMDVSFSMPFTLPWRGILLSSGAVFILLAGIMRYSMAKIGQKNMIETIQNENI